MADSSTLTATTAIGRRRASRARLQLNAEVETTTGVTAAVLRNLSCTGAMIEGDQLPPLNRTAVVKCVGIAAMGVVVWREEHRCGVEFFDPIEVEEVISTSRLPPERPPTPQPYHWSLARNAPTAEDWRKAQEFARGERGRIRGFS